MHEHKIYCAPITAQCRWQWKLRHIYQVLSFPPPHPPTRCDSTAMHARSRLVTTGLGMWSCSDRGGECNTVLVAGCYISLRIYQFLFQTEKILS